MGVLCFQKTPRIFVQMGGWFSKFKVPVKDYKIEVASEGLDYCRFFLRGCSLFVFIYGF